MIFATNNEGKLKSIFGKENITSLKDNVIFIDISPDESVKRNSDMKFNIKTTSNILVKLKILIYQF